MPNPVAHPLAVPVVTGTTVTVDVLLNDPTRITRAVTVLSNEKFLASRIFSNGGSVAGGAVLYDEVTSSDLYGDRKAQEVAPLAEFPVLSAPRRAPKVARVSKYGGKWPTSDEAKQRNNTQVFDRELRLHTNGIIRDDDLRAMAVVEASIAAQGGALVFVGTNWNNVVTAGASASTNSAYPHADLARAQGYAEVDGLGVQYDTLIVHTNQAVTLRTIYKGDLAGVLADQGFTGGLFSSPRMTPGTAYVVAAGQMGQRRIEKPLGTEVWREPGVQATWTQLDQRSVLFADFPYAIRKITGLAG